jgi:hypothetical protein
MLGYWEVGASKSATDAPSISRDPTLQPSAPAGVCLSRTIRCLVRRYKGEGGGEDRTRAGGELRRVICRVLEELRRGLRTRHRELARVVGCPQG